jgi:ABC-type multidrug transport system permease subunit
MASQAIVDLPWNIIASVLLFFTFYYPIGLYQNAQPTDSVNERGVQFWIFVLLFLIFSQSFGLMAIAAIDTAEGGR